MSVQWYFRDNDNKVQGPFGNEEMRAWYEAGYLKADLLVAKGDPRSNAFKTLAELFPNGSNAFMDESPDQGSEGGQWYFLDRNHQQQGPFTDIHMRQWHMAGYFEPTLQITNVAFDNPTWAPLREYFPNVADAFAVDAVDVGSTSRPTQRTVPVGSTLETARAAQRAPAGKTRAPVASEDPRFNFPEWLPVPPRYRGVKKIYPSEKNGGKRRVAIRDVNGHDVSTLV
ncbi:GRB10-interacting GYF protein 2 [Hondaea fermentalgiana]|uniref:GRB10-interacting GYF protein 2 n=1 Tax=Hondaea fermentalgiana TaxID=2315210 RepID=A0A2R5GUA2_9STRA|nr:GRB10-interacting GYF protein 2 [Hondaea fermentalgiana]|eukprot:GBG33338.1 GRB10-interacting GYF protein 2 [Hondaea fermentalgiana]